MDSTGLRPSTPTQHVSKLIPTLSPTRILQPLLSATPVLRTPQALGPLSPVNQNGSFAWDRVIKSGKVLRRVKKKGAWKSSWKEAYLVLRPNLLSVYKDKDETELRVSITLSDVTAVAPVKKSRTQNVFGVFSPAKNYHFAGLTPHETTNWITLIRTEAHTDEQDELRPPSPAFKQTEHKSYDTTDHSADDDLEPQGSPEATHWTVKSQKQRSTAATVKTRNVSYPTHEAYTTSQSSMSDSNNLSSSAPQNRSSYLTSSLPKQSSPLPPIADESPLTTTPIRPTEHLHHATTSTGHPVSHSLHPTGAAPQTQPKSASLDPSRIVKQSHLKLQRTTPHPSTLGIPTKQWKSVWVVLRPQSLSLYKSQSEYTPLAIIPCWSIVEAGEVEKPTKRREKPVDESSSRESWTFQVIGEEKTWRLAAGSEAELVEWLGAFKSVVVGWREGRKDRAVGEGRETGGGLQPKVVDWEDNLEATTTDLDRLKLQAGGSAGSGLARSDGLLSSSAPVYGDAGLGR